MLARGAAKEWYDGRSFSGTPQGGVLSPLLANIYLNELDQYMENGTYARMELWQKAEDPSGLQTSKKS
jgi:retron-type reverse transcriptase